MTEYTSQTTIDAPADEVFAFVSEVNRLPEYLPAVKESSADGNGHAHIRIEFGGQSYETDCWYQLHEHNRTMLWGSTGRNKYSGDLEVMDQGATCILTINLKFEPAAGTEDAFKQEMGARHAQIHQDLAKALEAIKEICEQATGPVPVKAGQDQGYLG